MDVWVAEGMLNRDAKEDFRFLMRIYVTGVGWEERGDGNGTDVCR